MTPEPPEWETPEFFEWMSEYDRRHATREHLAALEASGASETFVQAEALSLAMFPGLAGRRVVDGV